MKFSDRMGITCNASDGNGQKDLFISKIPFRGSIAYGEMTVDLENSIFFGQPLIDAYLLGEQLQSYGIACHASAEKK